MYVFRRLVVLAVLCLTVAGLAWAWVAQRANHDRAELEQARTEVEAGRFHTARARLARLAERRPNWPEVELQRGVCEAALGRVDSALEHWSRVPEASAEAAEAALFAAKLAIDHGRFSDAEATLPQALRAKGPIADEARLLRRQLLLFTVRLDELRDALRDDWSHADQPAAVLRQLWLLDGEAFPIDAVRTALAAAERSAPDDDRVWLGQANLALRVGQFDAADEWLQRCEARRPNDPPVLRARLRWALATDHLDSALHALRRMPEPLISDAFALELQAHFAASRGDLDAERDALQALLELEPGHTEAQSRLADLATQTGALADVETLRRRKAELDQAKDHYRMLLTGRPDPSQAAELAQTAERLGREFDAQAWWTLAIEHGTPAEARQARAALERRERAAPTPETTHSGPSLASRLEAISSRSEPRRTAPTPDLTIPTFQNNAAAANLRFHYQSDRTPLCRLPETMGGGVGLIDFDGDGWLDIYVIQGGTLESEPGQPAGDRLFRNRGDGTFEDVSESSGIAPLAQGYGHGVTVADFDNDGHPDLFLTRWRTYQLLRNRGDGTFEDVTEAVGLGGDRDWPTSAAFADLDGDGLLDLYVCHYLDWDSQHSEPCRDLDSDRYIYCVPRKFEALPDRVYRNDGDRFVEVTEHAGFNAPPGRGLGVVAADLDGDGRIDLYVANDMNANFLYRNLGDFQFEEVAELNGAAANAQGGYQAGMGVACGDFNGNGRFDLAVTNFYGEGTTFYQNLGAGMFADRTSDVGLLAPSLYLLGFGLSFLDANNDGFLDLASANGHVNDFSPSIPHAMPAQLLLGNGTRFVDVSSRAGPPWQVPRLGRGLAVGDLNNDGRLDLLVLAQDGPLALFANQTDPIGNFLLLQLEGTDSNRDAVGALVLVTTSDRVQHAQRLGGGSFLSASDPRLHFGLADAPRVESIEVRWPSGSIQTYQDLPSNTGYLLREGDPEPNPLPGIP